MEKKSYVDYVKTELAGNIKNMQNPNCTLCNECCSIQTLLTQVEFEALADYFKKDVEGKLIFKNANNRLKRYAKQNTAYIMCPFTDELTKRCRIYDKRPTMCRKFHCNPNGVLESNQYKLNLLAEPTTRQLGELFESFFKLYPALKNVMLK